MLQAARVELPSCATRRQVLEDPLLTEIQLPIDPPDVKEAGENTESALPEVPSESGLVERTHRTKTQEVQCSRQPKDQPLPISRTQRRTGGRRRQASMLATRAERQHNADNFIWAFTKTVADQLSYHSSGTNPPDLAAIARCTHGARHNGLPRPSRHSSLDASVEAASPPPGPRFPGSDASTTLGASAIPSLGPRSWRIPAQRVNNSKIKSQ